MLIKILGSGCKKCAALESNTRAALTAAGLDAEIQKVTDIVDIAGYGIMATPGLVIDDKVVSTGRVLSASDIGGLLGNAASASP